MNATSPFRNPALLALGAMFLISPAVSGRLQPNDYEGGRSRDMEARRERNASSIGVMLGEVRTALSDILMIKTERYMHNGIAYRPRKGSPDAVVAGASHEAGIAGLDAPAPAEAHDDDHGEHDEHEEQGHVHDDTCIHLDDAGAETVIPGEEDDFRGFIGRLHRAVSPYQDAALAHHHTDATEILPWFRIMTLSDPHHVQGYATGSWWLRSHDPEEAMAFANEGIANNPEAYAIFVVKGQILLSQARGQCPDIYHPDPATRRILEEAAATYQEGARAALRAWRRAGPDGREHWTKYQYDDALAAMRMAALMERHYGDPARATVLAREFLAEVGEDAPLARLAAGDDATDDGT
jgi:hypothetical protein